MIITPGTVAMDCHVRTTVARICCRKVESTERPKGRKGTFSSSHEHQTHDIYGSQESAGPKDDVR